MRKQNRYPVLLAPALAVSLAGAASALSLQRIALRPGESYVTSAALDASGDEAVFTAEGSDFRYSLEGASATIIAVDLKDFTLRDRLRLRAGENAVRTALVDGNNHLLFLGTAGDPNQQLPAKVIEVSLQPLRRKRTLKLPAGEFGLYAAVLPPSRGQIIFGTGSGSAVSVRKVDMSLGGILGLQHENNGFRCAVLNTSGTIAYFATASGDIMKVRLSDFNPMESATLFRGDNGFRSAFTGPPEGTAYFGTGTAPARLVRVSLDPLRQTGLLTLPPTSDGIVAGAWIPRRSAIYLVTGGSAPHLIKVDRATFKIMEDTPLPPELGSVRCAVFDPQRAAVYLGTEAATGMIVQVPLEP